MSRLMKEAAYSACVIALTMVALKLVISQLRDNLEPLYGSVPSELWFEGVIKASIIISAMDARSNVARTVCQLLIISAPVLLISPSMYHWSALYTARMGNPRYGPLMTHLMTFLPISYVLFVTPMVHIDRIVDAVFIAHPNESTSWLPTGIVLPIIWWFCPQWLLDHLPALNDRTIVLFLFILEGARAFLMTGFDQQPRRRTGFAVAIVLTALVLTTQALYPNVLATRLPHPLKQPYLHPTYPLQILSSTPSRTGVVVVGDLLPTNAKSTSPRSLRYLRASHSLIGGVWIEDKIITINGEPLAVDEQGQALGDSIYSAFVLQEAARLFYTPERIAKPGKALIIGLGAGISASGFANHNWSTTIVEIDPAVYGAARRYFGLRDPGPGNVFLEDARGWVQRRASAMMDGSMEEKKHEKLYDLVIHDCFSGGGVPEKLFTVEFLTDVKAILQPSGIVTVNFAGKAGSRESRAILITLEEVFPQCRAFHDSLDMLTDEQLSESFHNIVFFCTSSVTPLRHRQPSNTDFLNSYMRQLVLSSLAEREVDLTLLKGDFQDRSEWILTDKKNELGEWQKKGAFEHWKLMREAMPREVWETY